MHKGDGFIKASWKSLFHCQNVWSGHGPAMVRLASSDSWKATLFYRINEVLTFCWLFSAVLSVSGYKYMWASQYVRSRTGRLLLERLQVAEEENQDIDTTSVSADCKHPTGFPAPFLKIFIAQSITYSTFYFYLNLYL